MPVFEYKCPQCGKKFTELVGRYDEKVSCPACGESALREWAGEIYTATGKTTKHCSGNCSACDGCK